MNVIINIHTVCRGDQEVDDQRQKQVCLIGLEGTGFLNNLEILIGGQASRAQLLSIYCKPLPTAINLISNPGKDI